MIRGLIAFTQVCIPASMKFSFWRTRIKLNYEERKPQITVQVQTWLTQRNSPESDTKEEYFINTNLKKRKRTKTVIKGLTKAEAKKAKESNPKEREKESETRGEMESNP